jgi:N-glycosylase/DNA lyase
MMGRQVLQLPPEIPFDLDCTLGCGQVFRWDYTGDWWHGVVGSSPISIRQSGNLLEYSGADEQLIRRYFQLDLDLESILRAIDHDPVIHAAIADHRGLRIVRQEPWECLISYICAQNANIPFIRRMIANMAERFGEPLAADGECRHAFPNPEVLAACSIQDLRVCSLGYRAPYVLDTARQVAGDPDWAERVRALSYPEAHELLMQYRGVGPKVSDCILLFAFGRYEAFPVDVWLRKVMYRHYLGEACSRSALGCREYRFIGDFAREHFGPFAGYAQEYLYAAIRGLEKSD